MPPDLAGRFLVTAFFAIVLGQSSLDKVFDRKGNLDFVGEQFKGYVPAWAIPWLLTVLTILEGAAALLCVLGIVTVDFAHRGFGIAAAGVSVAALALLALIFGQRLTKQYGGAAVVAAYFAVALIGLALF